MGSNKKNVSRYCPFNGDVEAAVKIVSCDISSLVNLWRFYTILVLDFSVPCMYIKGNCAFVLSTPIE
jgi:hypothetical protein